jgi:hypothetical protein
MESKKASQLVRELRELLIGHLEKHKNLSINGLSKKCGVAASTLRRILSEETKEDPNPNTVLGIVSAVTKESCIDTLLKKFDGEIHESLRVSYSMVSKYSYRPELAEVLIDSDTYIVYKLAANRVGTSASEIVELLGNPALKRVEELLDSGLLLEKEGVKGAQKEKRYHAVEKNFMLPNSLILKHIPELLRYTKTDSRYVKKTMMKNISESVSVEVYNECWKIQAEAGDKIAKLINQEESNGNVPFFFTYFMNTLEAPGIEESDADAVSDGKE